MQVTVNYFQSGNNRERSVQIDKLPDLCTLCNKSAHMVERVAYYNRMSEDDVALLELVVICPRNECRKVSVAYYIPLDANFDNFRYTHSKPATKLPHVFNPIIKRISPEFIIIYNQSRQAEDLELDKIAGVGYRKALEFLIKDYLVHLDSSRADEIKQQTLGRCINDFVTDANVKNVAKRAVWIGNDETHYVRKWTEKDVTDLKKIIQLVTYWIESEVLTRELVEESMPERAQ